jgi:hypothetical protein
MWIIKKEVVAIPLTDSDPKCDDSDLGRRR